MPTQQAPQGEIWEQDTTLLPRIDLQASERHETIPMLIAYTKPLSKICRPWQFVSIQQLFARASHD